MSGSGSRRAGSWRDSDAHFADMLSHGFDAMAREALQPMIHGQLDAARYGQLEMAGPAAFEGRDCPVCMDPLSDVTHGRPVILDCPASRSHAASKQA